jgi:hypothetical protein
MDAIGVLIVLSLSIRLVPHRPIASRLDIGRFPLHGGSVWEGARKGKEHDRFSVKGTGWKGALDEAMLYSRF